MRTQRAASKLLATRPVVALPEYHQSPPKQVGAVLANALSDRAHLSD